MYQVTEANLTWLEQRGYPPLVEMYRAHTPTSPKLDMFACIHNLLFILLNFNWIREAAEYYNYNNGVDFDTLEDNIYFKSLEDWEGGILKDNYGIPFQISTDFIPEVQGCIDIEKALEGIKRVIPQLMACYTTAKENGHLEFFWRSFIFDGTIGCLRDRFGFLFAIDWQSEELGRLCRFSNEDCEQDSFVMSSEANATFVQESTWSEIKKLFISHKIDDDKNHFFYFKNQRAAKDFIYWSRNQNQLHSLGIFTIEPVDTKRKNIHQVTLTAEQFNAIPKIAARTSLLTTLRGLFNHSQRRAPTASDQDPIQRKPRPR